MNQPHRYEIVLLPRTEVAARDLSLREAVAWMRTYNHVMAGGRVVAVVAEENRLPQLPRLKLMRA
jgi:hypothetical protein